MSRSVEPDFRDILPQVRVPTLLIWGDDDKRSPLSCGEAMRDSIPGSRLLVIRSAGHLSNMEQPELFNAAVRDFLRSVEAGG
jgi:pimeloyl-ACP methyl ester carboxylesterase